MLKIAAALSLSLASIGAQAAQPAAPAPLGLTMGTECSVAMKKLGVERLQGAGPGEGTAVVNAPAGAFPGTKAALIACTQGRLHLMSLKIDKGGVGNPNARSAYDALAAKYRRVRGGPVPTVGEGFALFESAGTYIQLEAAHMGFDFTVMFMDKMTFDFMEAERVKAAQADAANRKNAF